MFLEHCCPRQRQSRRPTSLKSATPLESATTAAPADGHARRCQPEMAPVARTMFNVARNGWSNDSAWRAADSEASWEPNKETIQLTSDGSLRPKTTLKPVPDFSPVGPAQMSTSKLAPVARTMLNVARNYSSNDGQGDCNHRDDMTTT